ncbi:MAG: radical SAM protein, partial [Candidatus Altiarchaeota archaeon]|nr:radical SAM protein [Candidatus Altiarchaeota archaeon]
MIHDDVKNILRHQHYHLVGRHSAVKPCLWLKKALRGEGFCYKQKFYGIESHRCMQMTPAVSWCTHACIFCWRNTEHTLGQELEEFDDPEFIVDESLKAHKQAISGFGGTGDVDKKLLDEAKKPNQVAISLSGEPLTYPEMGSLISEFKKKNMTVYLVTNGTMPERLAALTELPTNLYLSVVAPDKVTHSRVCAPLISNAWENIIKSIELMPSFGTRTVVRVTA